MGAKDSNSSKEQITVNRAKYDSITLYEISEEELEIIEQGSPTSNYLNFSLVLLSTFLSFLATLSLAEVEGDTLTFFAVITVVSGLGGVMLMILWLRTRQVTSKIFQKIRSRKSVEKVREIAITGINNAEKAENEQETL